MPSAPVNEADLHAFVDGELAVERRAEVARYLATEPAEQARVENWQRQNRLLRATFAAVEREAVPVSLSLAALPVTRPAAAVKLAAVRGDAPAVAPSARQTHFFLPTVLGGLAAVIVAVLLLEGPDGGRLGDLITSPRAATLAARTLAALPDGSQHGPNVRSAGFGRAGATASPDLADQGYALVGGDMQDAGASGCFYYAKAAQPLALCVERASVGDDPSFHSFGDDTRRAISWREKSTLYALAGPLSKSDLLKLARLVHAQATER